MSRLTKQATTWPSKRLLSFLDDPLADAEFHWNSVRSSGRRPPRLQVQNCPRDPGDEMMALQIVA
jgi:hypothetical protein